jgi:hypothetical protein
MKLHYTLIEEIVELYKNHGGYTDERRLKDRLKALDISIYERQDKTQILVSDKQKEKTVRGH